MGKEKIPEEVEGVEVENEKLREDFMSKVESCEQLKKVQNEQVTKIREATSKIEMLMQQLLEKEEEIASVNRSNEDLKCNLNEKECSVRHLNAANAKLRAEHDERNRNSEQEIRRLVLALDEANELSIDQEQNINVLKAEIEGLKGDPSVSKKKCLEAEKAVKNPRELRERDDLLVQIHRSKLLEIFKTGYRFAIKSWLTKKTKDAKSQLDCLNSQRDKEVASLRHKLGTKESIYREMEYRALSYSVKMPLSKFADEKVESLDQIEERWLLTQKERERHQENEFGDKLHEVCDALETANVELAEARKRTATLTKKIESSDHLEVGRTVEETINKEKHELVRVTEEKDGIIVNLRQQVASLVQELKAMELEAVNSAEENIHQLTKEHDKIIEEKLLLVSDSEARQRTSEALVENNTKLSTDRENLLGFFMSLGDRTKELSSEDSKLMGILGRIVQSFDNDTT
ncbi:hypothetical protein F3Y22_tig00112530pilonHSYRG00177 [Hibiscus syriacus]|uniref:Uncharacterized protein n=1 Tax=Hibiscus syriacus TaxID=106335 RepID=A0A6A2Y5E8_HIBSY|nr:hypothetical protein F3Y22_tig00112530pilonHSYRG00177 [Hibiscus syriacus]